MDRYEEALERAKKGLPIDEVFPELKESESERIRRCLLDWIKNSDYTGIAGIPKDDVISWLEKQKEQKTNPYTGTGFDYNGHHWGMCARDGGVEIIVDEKIRDRVSFESENIKWSNSDAKEMFIKALERAVEQTKNGYELTDCDKHSWWEDFKAYSEINPAEWSKEDEKMIQSLILEINKYVFFAGIESKKIINFFKSLRPQSKQKNKHIKIKFAGKIYQVFGKKELPGGGIGYIIEDEPGHYDCITNPDEVLGGGYGIKSNGSPFPTKEANYDQTSLWKPSKEQMKCLKDFVNKVGDLYNVYNVYTSRYDAYPTLKSLLHDIEKLYYE